jgi:hypothetical protein
MRSTALKQFTKLESTGLWREAPELQRREVIVNFGEASLTIADPRSESALSHWSLPAVERLNPGEVPALYAPGREALETLEIDDKLMIEALEKVRAALASARPRPGRLRGSLMLAGTALVMLLGAVFIPGAMVDHTAAMVPQTTRLAIGRAALDDLGKVAGAPCADPSGEAALRRLATRLFGAEAPGLYILRDGQARSLHLPGNIITLHRDLVEKADGPEVLAGFALAEDERSDMDDPLVPLLRHAGLRATFGLLTTGQLEPASVAGYGSTLLTSPPLAVPDAALLARFAAADVPSTPYAKAFDPTGNASQALIEADPLARGERRPLMTDSDWIGLQSICAD